jgi:hypothetical protein
MLELEEVAMVILCKLRGRRQTLDICLEDLLAVTKAYDEPWPVLRTPSHNTRLESAHDHLETQNSQRTPDTECLNSLYRTCPDQACTIESSPMTSTCSGKA